MNKSSTKTTAKVSEKKTTTKAAATKTVKKTEPKYKIIVEYADKKVSAATCIDKAAKAYKKTHADAVVTNIDLYIKPEENAVYYVVNGDASPTYKINL